MYVKLITLLSHSKYRRSLRQDFSTSFLILSEAGLFIFAFFKRLKNSVCVEQDKRGSKYI